MPRAWTRDDVGVCRRWAEGGLLQRNVRRGARRRRARGRSPEPASATTLSRERRCCALGHRHARRAWPESTMSGMCGVLSAQDKVLYDGGLSPATKARMDAPAKKRPLEAPIVRPPRPAIESEAPALQPAHAVQRTAPRSFRIHHLLSSQPDHCSAHRAVVLTWHPLLTRRTLLLPVRPPLPRRSERTCSLRST
jgi:hypothetical protein